ncbi:Oxidoreductase [Lachnellula subtilissima]|uniref:Oxidoreductase n=1 Tax=Lachnellula subtilissima TaxID=602034 RepID=A0A8H8REY2_9HELO|nr:Oxidoreductase [Lachnellula subtilissima]
MSFKHLSYAPFFCYRCQAPRLKSSIYNALQKDLPANSTEINAHIAALPQGLVALFIGATSGIGQGALQHFFQHASSLNIYTVARVTSVASHENLLATLRQSNPTGTYTLITADVSLVCEIDKVVKAITQKESRIDIVFMSAGFMTFKGRQNTSDGLDPSMTTYYYSRM